MRRFWRSIVPALIVGVVAGAAAILVSLEGNRYTSTEAFCTSCHSMTFVANDPHFLQSAHRSNAEGVLPSCGDCHIPRSNWFVETWTHVSSGTRDVIAELTHNYGDPKIWAARRIALAHEVRLDMRTEDSVTCRSCHDAATIHPASEAGKAAHALMRAGHATCIDCHYNLVHAPVPPTMEFIRSSGINQATK
jgi:nitrate/TMAO reductase-like tetraheme cytochrome c subunit